MEHASKYKFGEFEADVRAGELRRKGQRLKLQLQPFYVLVALLERPKDVVTREELRQRIWPEDTFVDFDHSLNTAVAKVRDALGDSAGSPRYVETIAKRGYRFLGEVEAVGEAGQAALATQAKPSPAAAVSVTAQVSSTQGRPAQPVSSLPRASRSTTRLLFTLAQVMYVVFYIAALFRWERLAQSAETAWRGAGTTAFVVYMVTALAGLAVRLYLITATAFDYHLLGEKYRRIFPALFVLDMIWALSPLLLKDRIGMGLALGACAALIYMPFAQRVLMKMMQPTS
ncbi:MAG: transcriptional regulator [Acidobacteriia bacterium]|nr:transcriptional regulator [Terriglobia bacterium]